ncbi:preprotein translocase subunit SecD/SecD/SecF fusion protein [Seinonella peptonophila]|uniref:Protein translocase subunit SecD n=1 Tax=Seinonella peptonophila TaxID=112248 RepID=A0A1M4TQY5_9BACL|nr:protein translocase subunit SecD [Seinonella peptonophila]SHE46871.1 preprotein translocase subunit SecD/SecD/SecF fusion protein [Seinonella peptonophila]
MKVHKGRLFVFLLLVVVILAVVATTTTTIWGTITKGLDLQGGFEVLYQAEKGQKITTATLNDAASAIRNRIDIIGVSEPDITIEPPSRIRVQLAGVKDPKKAREIIGKPAHLTFRDPTGKQILIKGSDLKQNKAKVDYDQQGRPAVVIELKDAKKFEDLTKKLVGQPMPIFLDQTMLSSPVVQGAIPGGVATITGSKTVEEAQELADLLNAGALPIKLKEVQSYSVDASLGAASLKESLKAGLYAILLIFIFVIGYYRLPGFVAVLTLISYAYLVLLVFSLLHVTLTLPGIAAFILGVGMAVDANIIMSERIRDELRHGKSVPVAIRSGSSRSFLTIVDANLTTIIAGIILIIFGTAGVKGFAVSLIAGIIVSFITAVALSRLLINLLVRSNLFKQPSWFAVREDEISDL